MHRTQIQLTFEQLETLRSAARNKGVSLSAVIRELLDRELMTQSSARERMIASVGGFRSGHSDISVNHDEYLADAFER
jgi:hypothetical protein